MKWISGSNESLIPRVFFPQNVYIFLRKAGPIFLALLHTCFPHLFLWTYQILEGRSQDIQLYSSDTSVGISSNNTLGCLFVLLIFLSLTQWLSSCNSWVFTQVLLLASSVGHMRLAVSKASALTAVLSLWIHSMLF